MKKLKLALMVDAPPVFGIRPRGGQMDVFDCCSLGSVNALLNDILHLMRNLLIFLISVLGLRVMECFALRDDFDMCAAIAGDGCIFLIGGVA